MVSCYVCSPGWPRIGCGDQAGLELAALLFPLPLGLQTLWLVRNDEENINHFESSDLGGIQMQLIGTILSYLQK